MGVTAASPSSSRVYESPVFFGGDLPASQLDLSAKFYRFGLLAGEGEVSRVAALLLVRESFLTDDFWAAVLVLFRSSYFFLAISLFSWTWLSRRSM